MGAYIGLTPPADASTAITASLSAAGTLLSTPTAGYQSISVQLTGTWVGSVIFQASNDNTNWVNVQGYAFNTTESAIDTAVDNDIYIFPVIGFYFRAVVTTKTLVGWNAQTGASTSTDISFSGTVSATAYLRTQGLAGIGEAALTQAMDQATGTPINVGFQGFNGPGQQNAANSFPVAMPNEQILDKWISSRVIGTPLNNLTMIPMDGAGPMPANPYGWIDVSQYRSIYVNMICLGTLTGIITIEASNDGINLVNIPANSLYDTQGQDAGNFQAAGSSMGLGTNKNATRVGAIAWRYLRFRVTSAITGTGTVQVTAMLRMTPSIYTIAQVNQQNIAGSNPVLPASMISAQTASLNYPFFPLGGVDKSLIRSELIGAPVPNGVANQYLFNGPYARSLYTDLAGGMGVAGPQPFLAEDKTYPVNVRLERTTSGQDSVQDLLQQVLLELKAHNYYLRELPLAISSMNQTPNPSLVSSPSMQDDPENFADYQYRKGH